MNKIFSKVTDFILLQNVFLNTLYIILIMVTKSNILTNLLADPIKVHESVTIGMHLSNKIVIFINFHLLGAYTSRHKNSQANVKLWREFFFLITRLHFTIFKGFCCM